MFVYIHWIVNLFVSGFFLFIIICLFMRVSCSGPNLKQRVGGDWENIRESGKGTMGMDAAKQSNNRLEYALLGKGHSLRRSIRIFD